MRRLIAGLIGAAVLCIPASATGAPERPLEGSESPAMMWLDRRDPIHFIRHVRALRRAAEVVAYMTGEPAERFEDAWRAAPFDRQVVVLAALAQVGNDYRHATSDPDRGFDCSGLTRWAWGRVGVELPNTSRAQLRGLEESGEPMPGDVVGWPGHVMIWLGVDGYVVHAANSKDDVVVGEMSRSVKHVAP